MINRTIRYFLILYQKLNILPSRCRYYPSCSVYIIEAIEKYGIVQGLILGVKRILRCNQYFKGGIDIVP